jgi:hypothetical protein
MEPTVTKTPCGECHIQPGETCDICGASELTAAQKAYGCLWREITNNSPLVREARVQLRDSITKAERKAGIEWAVAAFGAVTEREVLACDLQAGTFPEKSI